MNVGNVGETLFLTSYKESRKAQKTDGRIFDFLVDEGKSVELKTDTYPMLKTPNFFMEQFGNIDTLALGGPWRAQKDNVDYFVYLFLTDKTFFWFEPESLCALLDPVIRTMKPRIIDNRTWKAQGYPIPRELCESICVAKNTF